jgi:hypothetical protein
MKKLAFFLILLALQTALGQEVCCPGGESAAVGISFTSGGTPLLTGRFWLSSRSAMEVGLAEPLNFNWFYVASLRVIHDYCGLRPYLELAVELISQRRVVDKWMGRSGNRVVPSGSWKICPLA